MYGLFLAITIFVSLLFIFVYLIINENRINLKKRLDTYTSGKEYEDYNEVDMKSDKKMDDTTFLSMIGKIFMLDKYFEKKKILLSKARLLLKPEEFFGISLIVGMLIGLLFFVIFRNILLFIIGFYIGFKIPNIYVDSIRKKREKKLNNQLPETLNILANGIRAGLSFTQAMVTAAKEMDGPISEDFNKIIHDNVLGRSMDEVLKDFADRANDDDVEILVTAVLIQRQVGGNLSEILDTISNTIRERVKLKGEIRTLTAQSKLSALIIGLIPPFIILILYFLKKDFLMPLFTTLPGNALLVIAVFMQALGIFILVKLLDLKV